MKAPDYIHYTSNPKKKLDEMLDHFKPDRVAFLLDENTKAHCLSHLVITDPENIIEIKSGEIHKNLSTCELLWSKMTEFGFSRKSLLVNLGGGVIGDMGGFVASTYKRGIRFINFPTTLLAAVDANIGGKLAIDFHSFKNHIGVFRDPDAVVIWDGFLKTLPPRELRSGFAEVIKHGLIRDAYYWEFITTDQSFPDLDWLEVIKKSVEIKTSVVNEDPTENGLRKILNFGHTIGHGIESWHLKEGKSLLHGEAISMGMVMEAFLSRELGKIQDEELNKITSHILDIFGKYEVPDLRSIMPIMQQDKKNTHNKISFSLLEGIGHCSFDQTVGSELIEKALDYYKSVR